MSAPRFDPTASLKRVREKVACVPHTVITVESMLALIDAEIALQGQVDRAAEMALECVGYREPRFDPTAARNLVADANDGADKLCDAQLYGFAKIVRRLAESLSSAISAIEGPEDGTGEIAEPARWQPTGASEPCELPCTGTIPPVPHYHVCQHEPVILMRCWKCDKMLVGADLATRAPSESAVVTDEQITEALRLGPGPAKHEAYARLRALFTAALTPKDQITREARE